MNKQQLHELIKNKQPNICQIVAIKNNEVVYKDTWNNYDDSDNIHIASVTKSITSLLVGIAIDKGYIKSVDQKVLDFFEEYKIKRGEKTIQTVEIKHLLTMTAPYKCKGEPWTKVCSSDDWVTSTLDLLGGKNGITNEFRYFTLGLQILNGIIFKASNMKTIQFANKYLFEPLDIKPRIGYNVKTKEEHIKFITKKTAQTNRWLSDSNEIPSAGFGLCLSAIDLAKIGLLCLNKGIYNNKRIVSEKWIKQITTPYINCDSRYNHMQYGYLWWIIDEKKHIYAAIGDSGNVIYINETDNLVITITSTFKPRILDRIDFIEEYIIPYVKMR